MPVTAPPSRLSTGGPTWTPSGRVLLNSTEQDVVSIESSHPVNGSNIKLTGTEGSSSTPSKFIRSAYGNLELVNHGYTKILLSVSDTGQLSFDSGFGSSAPAFGCRAWVNFNGTGTVAIRASGNVSSVTDNGVGDYTVNFTNAMVDTNYSITTSSSWAFTVGTLGNNGNPSSYPISTTACKVFCSDGSLTDMQTVSAAIFR